jgi:hypothetical protein
VQIALVKGLVAGAVNLALAFGRGASLPPMDEIAAAGFLGLFGYGVSLVLFVLALPISAWRAPAPIFPPRPSSARCWRWRCSPSR